MFNELIFLIHIILIAAFCLAALAIGPSALVAAIATQGVLSNLFVTKQITLLGLSVTCSDAFVVGAILCLNLLQEYYGKTITKKAIVISFFTVLSYLILSQIHLIYIPNQFDTMQPHFIQILHLMPRITIASVFVYLVTQTFDAMLFGFLKRFFNDKFPAARSAASMICSQFLDTVLFTFLALYGVVGSVWNVIIMSFAIKIIVIALFAPFTKLAKAFIKPGQN
ncbi:MAG: hypothetical protein US49_C0002G0111 [candidate division TM6 bacterium GW2011_GWF2_37_49]|nr:MAG: hypothetical protein US49_C0002G0111 [candidate division TM6 bacterium GW2011_GWF2_37_49]